MTEAHINKYHGTKRCRVASLSMIKLQFIITVLHKMGGLMYNCIAPRTSSHLSSLGLRARYGTGRPRCIHVHTDTLHEVHDKMFLLEARPEEGTRVQSMDMIWQGTLTFVTNHANLGTFRLRCRIL
jgi:hypothetical protein